MRHEVSYVFNNDIKTIEFAIDKLNDYCGYSFGYKKLTMQDGSERQFLLTNPDKWFEMPSLEALLKFICNDIYYLKDAVDSGILVKD